MTEYVVTRWYRAPELLLNCCVEQQKVVDTVAVYVTWSIYLLIIMLYLNIFMYFVDTDNNWKIVDARLDECVPQKTSTYISQYDLHISDMTVRKTIDFSAHIMTEIPRKEKEKGIFPDLDIDTYMKLITISVEGQSKNLQTEFVVKTLGLDICADTLVGDALDRGISGRQRKRLTTSILKIRTCKYLKYLQVTSLGQNIHEKCCLLRTCKYLKYLQVTSLGLNIHEKCCLCTRAVKIKASDTCGEMIVGPIKALFMDERSTGLDSSTTFQIVTRLQQLVHINDATTMLSLLQPVP
ncbi:hypothetical protein RYX36_017128 [Vicia faba]